MKQLEAGVFRDVLFRALCSQGGQMHRKKVGNHIQLPYNQRCTSRDPHQYGCWLLNGLEEVHPQKRDTSSVVLRLENTFFWGGGGRCKRYLQNFPQNTNSSLPNIIQFHFNPPDAPQLREIFSVKTALYRVVVSQAVIEEVLHNVILEVEDMLNAKPLGYISSNPKDLDPGTPNFLLTEWWDGCLPQVVYRKSELVSRCHWRHSQILADQFWSRFIKNYLPSLQSHQK